MSLVVASAALDFTWSEFGAVEYSGGSLSTQASCVIEVESKLRRGTLGASTTPSDAEVKQWLQRAKQELAEVRQFTWRRRYVTGTLTAGTHRYALPPDYSGGPISLRDTTNDHLITITSNHQFDVLYPDPGSLTAGDILLATIKNNELWVAPPPGADVIELEYTRSGDDQDPTDFSWLPEIERFRCCDFATAEAFDSIQDYPRAGHFRKKWNEGIYKAVRSDGKKRWAAIGFRARSIFQA